MSLISDLIFPNFCIGCMRPGNKICEVCISEIGFLDHKPCIICDGLTTNGKTHLACIKNNKYTPVMALTTYAYSNIVKKIILKIKKTQRVEPFIDPLFTTENFKRDISNFKTIDFITHIPSNKLFSQRSNTIAAYLASYASNYLNIKCISIFRSNLFAKKQKTLNRQSRFINIQDTLNINPKYLDIHDFSKITQNLTGKKFLIIDDVITSGATLLYATYLLKKAGVDEVYLYALAKDLKYK